MSTQLELWPEMAETWEEEAAAAWEAREAAKEEREERRRKEAKAQAAARRHAKREAALVEAFASGKVHERNRKKAEKKAKLPKVAVPKVKKARGMAKVEDIDAYWKARGL